MCKEKFQAPALPAAPAPLPAAAAALPTAAPAADQPDVYGVEEPAAPLSPPPAATATAPPPKTSAPAPKSPPPPPPTAPSLATDFRGGFTVPFSPRVLPWVAVGALVLIFILTLFSWVGAYWNGRGVLTQNAWGTATGYWGELPAEWKNMSGLVADPKDIKELDKIRPHWNVLVVFYLLFFLLTLAITIASAAVPLVPGLRLPPEVTRFLPWRWAAVVALCLLTFLILLGQSLKGYSLENQSYAQVEENVKKSSSSSSEEDISLRVGRDYNALGIEHTTALRLVFLLKLVALVSAALLLWVENRSPAQPIPRLELRY